MVPYDSCVLGSGAILHLFHLPRCHVLFKLCSPSNYLATRETPRGSTSYSRAKLPRPWITDSGQSRSPRHPNPFNFWSFRVPLPQHTDRHHFQDLENPVFLAYANSVDSPSWRSSSYPCLLSSCVTSTSIPLTLDRHCINFPSPLINWFNLFLLPLETSGSKCVMELHITELSPLSLEREYLGKLHHKEPPPVRKEHQVEPNRGCKQE